MISFPLVSGLWVISLGLTSICAIVWLQQESRKHRVFKQVKDIAPESHLNFLIFVAHDPIII